MCELVIHHIYTSTQLYKHYHTIMELFNIMCGSLYIHSYVHAITQSWNFSTWSVSSIHIITIFAFIHLICGSAHIPCLELLWSVHHSINISSHPFLGLNIIFIMTNKHKYINTYYITKHYSISNFKRLDLRHYGVQWHLRAERKALSYLPSMR